MADFDLKQQTIELLEWYQTAGVDAVLDDTPINWLERGSAAPGSTFNWPSRNKQASSNSPSIPPSLNAGAMTQSQRSIQATPIAKAPNITIDPRQRPQTPLAPSEAETEARRIARGAATLDELGAALTKFDGCSLKATATNLCFYRGAPHARLMLIGEAPGRDEDIEGKPFVGRAGQLLDRMLGAIGLTESDVHITNIVYWRPPGNRTPTPQEALACRPFLDRQIELVNPDFVVAVGGAAAKEVLSIADGIMRLRGKWREIEVAGKKFPAFATLHPAYLLRTPAAKQLAWLDLLSIKSHLAKTR